MNEDKRYNQAKKIAQNKIAFLKHFIVFIFVMAVLAAINNLTDSGYQWWLWPALWWGIGVFLHFLFSFIFRGGGLKRLEEDLVKKEMNRIKGQTKS
ncbi:MAG: 2TM domain-containing protein [Spirochaetota bacterium]|nr:MAG: 2TM domain-containing protein [Spirochaetota bacterium]